MGQWLSDEGLNTMAAWKRAIELSLEDEVDNAVANRTGEPGSCWPTERTHSFCDRA
jgi:hypothetical protein